jgi:hypothetical protein
MPAPYCKTSAEAFALTHVFPNGYRRVGDERSPYQLVLDLQNECFRRFDEMVTALATERAARQRDVAALRAELMAERRAKDEAVSRLTAQLCAERRARDTAIIALSRELHAARRQLTADMQPAINSATALAAVFGPRLSCTGSTPLLRNAISNALSGS